MEKDNEIDKLFKSGLNDPEIPFNELDWEKMEQKLDAKDKKKVIPLWLFTASGIAAALVVCLFWYLASPDKIVKDIKKIEVADSKNQNPVNKDQPVADNDTISTIKPNSLTEETPVKHNVQEYVKSTTETKHHENPVEIPTVVPKENDKQDLIAEVPEQKVEERPIVAAVDSPLVSQKPDVLAQTNEPDVKTELSEKKENKSVPSIFTEKRKVLTLSIMAAPDVSNAKQNVDNKVSSNVGILATYALTNRLSVTTGAIYARKLYNYGGLGPASTTYMKNAWRVDADCIVLDVPLNVNYTFLKRANYSIGVNSGLSSYFMLNEKYKYITGPQGGTQKISEREFVNQNQHIFGVANFSLSFERRITNSLSFGIQPFMKVPLTGIGNGNARLKSTGVAFSLNLGLFPKSNDKK